MKRIVINFWLWLTGKQYRYGSIMWHVIHRDKKNVKDVKSNIDKDELNQTIQTLKNEHNKFF